jgi:endonuclease III
VGQDADQLRWIVDRLPEPPATPPDGLPLGNRRDPVEELVYIVLTVMTRSQRSIDAAMAELHAITDGDLRQLHRADGVSLREALRPTGLVERRALMLGAISRELADDPGLLDRAGAAADLAEAVGLLTSLPGVGIKTAKCILMYCYDRPVLPTDIHVLRVAKRLGLVSMHVPWLQAERSLEALVPPDLKYDVHVRFVWHGRLVCTSLRPSCGDCPVEPRCPSAGTPGAPRAAYV